MYLQDYSVQALRREIRRQDKNEHPELNNVDTLEMTLRQAASIAKVGFAGLLPEIHTFNAKAVYQIKQFQYELVVRRVNRIFRDITSIKQADRDTVIRRIISLLSEGVGHRAYKFDIRSFYESIDSRELLERIRADTRFSIQTTDVCAAFFNYWESDGVSGLPRGLALSATLALNSPEFRRHLRVRFSAASRARRATASRS